MATFAFKFDSVLRQRKHVESLRQREVAVLRQRIAEVEKVLRELTDSAARSAADLRETHLLGPLDMTFLAAQQGFQLGVQRKSFDLAQRKAALQQQLSDARSALTEAAKQRKIIEKLRDKAFEGWMTDRACKERRESDEIAMQMGVGAGLEAQNHTAE